MGERRDWKLKDGRFCFPIGTDDDSDSKNEFFYEFAVRRIKSKETRRERLEITAFVRKDMDDGQGEEECKVTASLNDLDGGIKKMREYGIVFTDDNARLKLKRAIEKNYRDIALEYESPLPEGNKLQDFLALVEEYVAAGKRNGDSGELVYIPVTECDALMSDSGYEEYEKGSLRKRLKEGGFIHTVGDRYTLVKRLNNRPCRVMAFYAGKLQQEGQE